MKYNPCQRTYGTKLLESKGDQPAVESPVTTRHCDIELFNRTGEIKYLGEEDEKMVTANQAANAKKIRGEITSIEQLESLGTRKEVAKKFEVSLSLIDGLTRSLKTKKASEEKELTKQSQAQESTQGPSQEELEKFYTDTEPTQELPKVEMGTAKAIASVMVEQIMADNEPTETPFAEDGEILDPFLTDMEGKWSEPTLDQDIEQLWIIVESDISILHKMHMERAEIDFQARLMGVIKNAE